MLVRQEPFLRLRENCVHTPSPSAPPSPQNPPNPNCTSVPCVIGSVPGVQRNVPTLPLTDRKRFNTHSARSGSVQRILSAMLRQGSHSFQEDVWPQHCG